ncbi:MAG TPA: triphosphoribosyl-dephospho-CoA synthase [Hyphomicrobium sp.]
MRALSEAEVREAFLAACRAELAALKPGNVHVHAGGHGMEVSQFEASAAAAAPFVAAPNLRVGERVLSAVEASLGAAQCNTNLGILLLAAPLAMAAETDMGGGLRDRTRHVLADLDAADAANAFDAIRRASPGGLGAAPEQDVAAPPTVGLLEAMALAADRDRIARAYVTDFEEVFAFGLPTLERIQRHTDDPALAVTTLHMAFLAEAPDSHIARKLGRDAAEVVKLEANRHRPLWNPVASPQTFAGLLAFDRDLKQRNINPGTTADFVVATLFARAIEARLKLSSLP